MFFFSHHAPIALIRPSFQQIKSWYNNRCRGADTGKQGRGDLKLDVNNKRKLAPVQAYCSYAWDTTLKKIVLERWEQEKASTSFDDEDDPLEDDHDAGSVEASIPLSFKLKIAKEVYQELSAGEKALINARREEDHKKLYRPPPQIENDGDRIAKLETHIRWRSLG